MAKIYAYLPNGAVEEIFLNVDQQTRISLSLQSFISTDAKNRNYFSYTLEIPRKENKKAIAAIDQCGARAILELKCFAFPGTLQINSDGKNFVKGQFIGGIANWTELLPEFTRELPFGSHDYTTASINAIGGDVTPYDGTNPIWYSLKKYNTFSDPNSVLDEDWRPDIMLKRIVEAMEEHTGYPIDSNLFDTQWFRRIMEPYTGDGRIEYKMFEYELNSVISEAGFSFLPQDPRFTITYDPLGYNTQTNFTLLNLDQIKVTVKVRLDITTVDPVNIYLFNNNIDVYESHTLYNGINELTFIGDYNSPNNIILFIEGLVTINPGSTFEIFYEALPFLGVEMLNRSIFPSDQKTLDRIEGMAKLFNLVWFFDGTRIIADPKWDVVLPTGETVPGFYRNIAFSDDLSGKIECYPTKSTKVDRSAKRLLTFSFKEDSDNDNVDKERQWAHTQELSDCYAEGEVIRPNPFYSAVVNTLIGDEYTTNNNFPALIPTWTDGSDDPSYDFEPSVIFKMGTIRGAYVREGNNLSTYPMAAQVALVSDLFPLSNLTPSANLGFSDYKGIEGLFSIFHVKDIDIINNGHTITGRMIVDCSTFNNIEEMFRRLKLHSSECEQGMYIIESIDIIGEKLAEVKLINIPQ